jgi:hypothetical protein
MLVQKFDVLLRYIESRRNYDVDGNISNAFVQFAQI